MSVPVSRLSPRPLSPLASIRLCSTSASLLLQIVPEAWRDGCPSPLPLKQVWAWPHCHGHLRGGKQVGGHPHLLNGFSRVVTKSEAALGWLKAMGSPQAGFVLVWGGGKVIFGVFFFLNQFPIFEHSYNVHLQHSPKKSGFPAFLEKKKKIQKNRCSNIGPIVLQDREPASTVHARLLYSLESLGVCLACTSSSQ